MKIKKSKLKKVIYEEVSRLLSEMSQESSTIMRERAPDEKEAKDERKRSNAHRREHLQNYDRYFDMAYDLVARFYEPGAPSIREDAIEEKENILSIVGEVDASTMEDALEQLNSDLRDDEDLIRSSDSTIEGLTGRPIDFWDYTVVNDFYDFLKQLTGEYLGP